MNSKIAITAIVLVAVIMGMSAVVPMIPQAFAGHDHIPVDICRALPAVCELVHP